LVIAAVTVLIEEAVPADLVKPLIISKNKDIKKTQQLLGFLFRPNYLEPKLKRN
jgi:hypothetical protein